VMPPPMPRPGPPGLIRLPGLSGRSGTWRVASMAWSRDGSWEASELTKALSRGGSSEVRCARSIAACTQSGVERLPSRAGGWRPCWPAGPVPC
jgi:hypothetical protein